MSTSSILLQDQPDLERVEALLVGSWHSREFSESIAQVEDLQNSPQIQSVSAACDSLLALDVAPELILVAQALPGAISQADVDRMQRLAPLARIVVVSGTWCEGELRTGQPCRGVLRLYWYELAPWWRAAKRSIFEGNCPSWSQPLDHFQAGRFSSVVGLPPPPDTIAIDSEDYSVFETMADAISKLGATAIWAKGQQKISVDAGIWDGGQLGQHERTRLQNFCRAVPGRVVALLDFPRVEHLEAARQAGASAVFGKPYIVEEVLSEL